MQVLLSNLMILQLVYNVNLRTNYVWQMTSFL